MKIYSSKDAIYEDYQLAIKFVLERPVHLDNYKEVMTIFSRKCRARVQQFTRMVENFRTTYPLSVGYFVEVAVDGDANQPVGVHFILLHHESGLELFTKPAKSVSNKLTEKALIKILTFLQHNWTMLVHGGVRINHVELRTLEKGVMCLPFSKFNMAQLGCVDVHFDRIKHLRDCNQTCFGGLLIEPPIPSKPESAQQANDSATY